MEESEIRALVHRQRTWFRTGATRNLSVRLNALATLQEKIRAREADITAALQADLGKSAAESYMCETGMALSELRWLRRHLPALAKPRRAPTPLAQFPARSWVESVPYGVVLILSPWNYPFLLSIEPLADAIAAGNTVILKPSAYSPHTSALVADLIRQCFPPEYVSVVTGGRAENTALLDQKFDHIFFTGSQAVGKVVMAKAAPHLTPVTLELGGKSPCVVERSANLKMAARRIVFGKYLNCGQTCVAPDYILCDASIRDRLVINLKEEILRQYGTVPLANPDYGRIINEKHFDRLLGLMDRDKVVHGGTVCRNTLQIEPTVLCGVTWEDPIMGEEIFGPLLPVLTYTDLDAALARVEAGPHPLAFYFFTGDIPLGKKVLSRYSFGGGCLNDVIIHLATSAMPFGGFGESGMGSYHGKAGFRCFTHQKSLVDRKTWPDLPMRYQPYRPLNGQLVRLFLR